MRGLASEGDVLEAVLAQVLKFPIKSNTQTLTKLLSSHANSFSICVQSQAPVKCLQFSLALQVESPPLADVSLPLSAVPPLLNVAVLLSLYQSEVSLGRGEALWVNGSFPAIVSPRLLAQRICLRFSAAERCDALSLEASLLEQGVGSAALSLARPLGSIDVRLGPGREAVLALHSGQDARVAASAFCARHR